MKHARMATVGLGTAIAAALVVFGLAQGQQFHRNSFETHEPLWARGDAYQNVGRWQRLSLGRPIKLAQQQQQLLQAELKRPVDFSDAYLDNLLLNVYGGPGLTEVWIDDLEIGPVADGDSPFKPTSR